MPRSRAVRLLGGVIVGLSVPGVRVTSAFGASKTSVRVSCDQRCPSQFPFACICDRSAEFPNNPAKPCFKQCGVAGSTCCCYPKNGRPTGANACPPGTRCGHPGESSCVCVNTCGDSLTCCGHNQYCANPRQKLCCNRGERGCGSACCQPNEECRAIRVGTSSSHVCTKRCPPNQAWCGRDKCCPPKWHCANESTGLCKRCWPNEEECGQKCCDTSTSRCCGKAGCCPKSRSCCNTGKKQICCPAGQKCATPILAGDIGIKPGTEAICCPVDRYHESPKLCCPPGQVALNQAGQQVGPGLSPFCCPTRQLCGVGGSRTCCQRSDVLGSQTCCNGKCVDTQFDPDNCGRCGNVCASRSCSQGVCAFT